MRNFPVGGNAPLAHMPDAWTVPGVFRLGGNTVPEHKS